ncbi:hypothetical protein A2697_00470 [Candidatus Curtissbacteria bacterium RIFCSPHIGHO2_01_FULL_41_44]|uniref:Major facilitator superfamily (MFS) profile domain-containing protein n=1 Tax=Candidatus Curtissbacteria bacterium RIFCSPLOWO2_01_FULL_42_50 TaxID=1797730 RepID=A0A1F5H286_9BACT|nr:MAG: hypothetical protein A2697_00470 [Candidatus Curtissbacteria bacterium RIFCSPHIGHO2_01_FULL_41_44]OGD92816.1 MAG: hypothetical protein A3C33_04835 [Candidatus Curtissbacteria bacterium RIFCSPHIGHO2_02_FULL_42_58]OGD96501.1 MAG: hypothetical protein A3E71_00600 [Candidatus Curtissbacteria bacterium RIFCSPHIGHO2_12_FULL_42_33]OGD98243.1 MAG: hypothetical protein A3B54_00370 [Candidatus Curtissbacteria bacterium RIFCSPLOWO2_01_FULL_42_50]OGE02837.1 MAG: hypothetical protein A3G16_05130 [Ca
MYKKEFRTLLIFYFSFLWFSIFSRSILPTYYLKQGFTFNEMIWGSVLIFASQIIALLTLRRLTSRISWYLAIITWLAFIFLIIKLFSVYQFYLAMFVSGLTLFFFFVFYNIAHFELTPTEKRGESSAVMFGTGSLISVIAPIFAGFLAQINIALIWIFSSVSFLICFYLTGLQKNFELRYGVKEALQEIESTRIFIFLQGIWEALVIGIIPIYTLFFIKTPFYYGTFVAYLALAGVVSTFLLGRFTDKLQKRSVFLYPLTLSMAAVTFMFPYATKNIGLWVILSGAISFLLPVFWNISTAMVVDRNPDLNRAIPGRELTLAFGRLLGLFITALSFLVQQPPRYIFLVLGVVILLFPAILYWNTRIKKAYKYL